MPDRSQLPDRQPPTEPDPLYPGRTEWLVDTLDQTAPETDRRARRGFPCGTLLLLLTGAAIIGALAWLLAGPPLPGAVAPLETATPTPTLVLPTREPPTPTSALLPTPTPVVTATPSGAFGIGDRVVISGTGANGVRLRAGAGLDSLTQGVYYDGDAFFVMPHAEPQDGYPVSADGYTWWRLRAADGLIGWTVEDFLQPAPLVVETPSPTPGP